MSWSKGRAWIVRDRRRGRRVTLKPFRKNSARFQLRSGHDSFWDSGYAVLLTLRPQYPWRKKGSEWQTECRLRAQRPSPPREALRPAREQTAPLTVAPLFKNSHESDVERNVYDGLVSAQTQFFCGGGALWFESTERFCPSFPVPTILPRPQLL